MAPFLTSWGVGVHEIDVARMRTSEGERVRLDSRPRSEREGWGVDPWRADRGHGADTLTHSPKIIKRAKCPKPGHAHPQFRGVRGVRGVFSPNTRENDVGKGIQPGRWGSALP
jgi:hypothetical protein